MRIRLRHFMTPLARITPIALVAGLLGYGYVFVQDLNQANLARAAFTGILLVIFAAMLKLALGMSRFRPRGNDYRDLYRAVETWLDERPHGSKWWLTLGEVTIVFSVYKHTPVPSVIRSSTADVDLPTTDRRIGAIIGHQYVLSWDFPTVYKIIDGMSFTLNEFGQPQGSGHRRSVLPSWRDLRAFVRSDATGQSHATREELVQLLDELRRARPLFT